MVHAISFPVFTIGYLPDQLNVAEGVTEEENQQGEADSQEIVSSFWGAFFSMAFIMFAVVMVVTWLNNRRRKRMFRR